jgi:hypothetical protein
MKTLAVVALAVVFVAWGFAQQPIGSNTGFGRVIYPGTGQPPASGATGFGRVLFPGTGGPPGSPLSITDTSFANRLGTTVSGQRFNGERRFRRFGQPAFGAIYAYPVYGGGYPDEGYAPYGYAPQDQPNITIVNPPPQTPQVIINQNFIPEHATPVMHDYTEDSSGGIHVYQAPSREAAEAPAEDATDYYLIAFKDHSIYSAFAYWVEGETLHYVTAQRVHNQASLNLVDRELTEKLNRDRNMQVKLPK